MFRSNLMALALIGAMAAGAWAEEYQHPQPAQQPGMTEQTQPGMQQREGVFANDAWGKLIRTQIARLSALSQELNFTQDQLNRLQTVLSQHQQHITRHASNVWEKRVALRDAVLADQPNEQMIRQASQNLGQAIGDFSVFAAGLKTQVAPIFTEQQRMAMRRYLESSEKDMQRFFADISQAPARAAAPGEPTPR
jgi:hypothetical protein